MTSFRTIMVLLALSVSALSFTANATDGLLYVETADGKQSADTRDLVQWTHARMVFDKDLARVAVGQSDTMEVEILGSREVLILAKEVGRTSLIVWYPGDVTETFLFSVVQDLSVLERALQDIHPAIVIELAPDRDALILRGTVPTVTQRTAAEAVAREYLNAGVGHDGGFATVLSKNDSETADVRVSATGSQFNGQETSAVINLIQVEQLPSTTQEKIQQTINELGGADVTVERILRGDVEDDAADTLLLKGQVQNQVALVRVLNIASRLFLGPDETVEDLSAIEAIADESGALISERNQDQDSQGNNSMAGNNLIGGNNNGRINNEIKANIGRAKLLSVSNGRILSMIEVRDLPQVRVSVQIHEVNRSRMKNWRPDMTLVSDGFKSESMTPGGSGMVVQPDGSLRITESGGSQQVENALQVLGGALTNQLQIGGAEMAFDLLFSLMETEGISRTLSRPTLTVLAGESALFQVGGEVPVPSAFAPPGTDTTGSGVFSGTQFRAFGVQLAVRPMVDENDRITLDVRPTVSMPDTTLTQEIAGSTGTNLNTTAFNTRSLETTTRLRDGQPLVLGGLVSRGFGQQLGYTPGLHKVPGLGWLAKSSDTADQDRELIIIVTPTIVREPLQNIAMWQFPSANELLKSSVKMPLEETDEEGE